MGQEKLILTGAAVLVAAVSGATSFGIGSAFQKDNETVRTAEAIHSGIAGNFQVDGSREELNLWQARESTLQTNQSKLNTSKVELGQTLDGLTKRSAWETFLQSWGAQLEGAAETQKTLEQLKGVQVTREALRTELLATYKSPSEELNKLLPKSATEVESPTFEQANGLIQNAQTAKAVVESLDGLATEDGIKAWARKKLTEYAEVDKIVNPAPSAPPTTTP